jgi:putative membrane protein
MKLLLRWAINAGVLLLIGQYIEGVSISGWYAALIAIVVLGLVNALIRPLLVLLTLPVNILTLGLFTFVINALMLWLVSSIVKGFSVDGFAPAFWAALILSIVSWIVSKFLYSERV